MKRAPSPPNATHEPPHVALLIETSLASGRDILSGIARYVREHGPWLLFHEARSLEEALPRWLKGWKGHGIIARVQTAAMAKSLRETRLPVVDVIDVIPRAGFPVVHVDDESIGAMGADHLLERGFQRFAFVGIEGENWSEARQSAFIAHLASGGFGVSVRSVPRHHVDDISWEVHQACLADWISKLPKPVGIMVCSDQRGGHVLEACRRAGVRVPDDVAVIGVDNDQALCGVCNPPLSSVWPNHSHVGYEAAKLLERLIRKEKNIPRRTLIPPKGIVTRLSSDTLAVDDPLAANILRLIRERACTGIRIDDIASVVGASRSVIQRRFRTAFGRSMNEALVQHRLSAAKTLLLETELPLLEIAERCGFRHQEYMGAVFKSYLKQTPAQFRSLFSLSL